MTPVEKLIEKIERDLGVQGLSPANFRRTYAGKNLRLAGAWSWDIPFRKGQGEILWRIGSIYPVSAFLKKSVTVVTVEACDNWGTDIEIMPEGQRPTT